MNLLCETHKWTCNYMIMNFPTYGQVCIIITYENVMKGFVNSFAIFP